MQVTPGAGEHMNRKSGSHRSPRGITLHTFEWLPDAGPQGVVIIAHGYGEHSGRYGKLARDLNARGFAVHALDFASHGKSAGRRGEVSSLEDFIADLHSFTIEIRGRWPGLPAGLLGHSFGGAVAAALCIREPGLVDALVLSSPYLRHGKPVPPPLLALVQVLSRVAPRVPVQKVEQAALSRIPAEVEAYRSDPLVYKGGVSAGTAMQLTRGREVIDRAPDLQLPLLVVHGDADRISHHLGSREFVDRVGSPRVTFELIGGGYHELLNDLDGDRMRDRICDWLQAQLPEE